MQYELNVDELLTVKFLLTFDNLNSAEFLYLVNSE